MSIKTLKTLCEISIEQYNKLRAVHLRKLIFGDFERYIDLYESIIEDIDIPEASEGELQHDEGMLLFHREAEHRLARHLRNAELFDLGVEDTWVVFLQSQYVYHHRKLLYHQARLELFHRK